MGKFRLGYTECASEVARYLSSVDGLSPEVHTRLMNHLSGNCQRLSQAPEPTMTSQPSQPIRIQIPMATQASALPGATVQTVMAPSTTLPQQISRVSPVSAQPAQYVTGAFHVIPHATMTSPEMTVIMPNNVSPNNIISNVTPLYLNTSNVTSVPNQAVRIQPTAPVLTATVRPVPQQPDHPKVMSPPLTSAQYKEVMHPQGLTHKQQLLAVEIPPVHAKGVMLREEKVWRPWWYGCEECWADVGPSGPTSVQQSELFGLYIGARVSILNAQNNCYLFISSITIHTDSLDISHSSNHTANTLHRIPSQYISISIVYIPLIISWTDQ